MPVFSKNCRRVHLTRTALAAALMAMASPAICDTIVSLTGPVAPSAVSGFSGTPFTIGGAEGVRAVYGIMSVERRDKPCLVTAMTEDANDSGDDSGGTKNLCGDDATSNEMTVQFSDTKFANRTFVRAVRVCMNKDNDRVKGIQIRGRLIDANGNVSDLPSRYPDSSGSTGMSALVDLNAPADQRPNCDSWKKWVECPTGQIATAITAHFGAGSTPRSLTGIGLQCRAVGK
jgi:hypothetical protein